LTLVEKVAVEALARALHWPVRQQLHRLMKTIGRLAMTAPGQWKVRNAAVL